MKKVYIHGLGQTSASWNKTLLALDTKESPICPDLAELIQDSNVNYIKLYQAFSRLCDGFDSPIDLCGLSLGAVLALNYAIDVPEKVRSLVLIAPQYKMPKGLLHVQNLLFHLIPKAAFSGTGFGKKEFMALSRSMTGLDFSHSLHKISCPALIVCGEKDTANKRAAETLTAALRGGRLQIVKASGHEVNVDAPGQLADILRDFYGQIS